MANEGKSAGEELFELLNADYVTLSTDSKARINELLENKENALKSKDFLERLDANAEHREKVAGTLEQLSQESTATDKLKEAPQLMQTSLESFRQGTLQQPETPAQKTENVTPPQQQTENQSDSPQKKPRGTMTIEAAEEAKYRGKTLTAEQEQLLKDNEQKKIANVQNVEGDRDKSPKRDKAKDKFKDEDIIKYMYEDWFLGGMSWLFNKTEDFTLAAVDSFCDRFKKAPKTREQEKDDPRLPQAKAKVAEFAQATNGSINNLSNKCAAKAENLTEKLNELRGIAGGKISPSSSQFFNKEEDKEFVDKIIQEPSSLKTFDAIENMAKSNLNMIEQTGKLAQLMTSIEMTNEMMETDKKWRDDEKKKNSYQNTADLNNEMQRRSLERHQNLLDAVSVISEDTRLYAEIAYNQLPAENKPEFQDFLAEQRTQAVSAFLTDISAKTKEVAAMQNAEIAANNFEINNKQPAAVVRNKIKETDKLIKSKIENGEIYKKKEFENTKSTQRVSTVSSLYQLACHEASPQNMYKTLEQYKSLSDMQSEDLQARRTNNNQRKANLEAVKKRLMQRDGKKAFQSRINAMTGNKSRS